ncbi:MAG: hypothetical protein Q8K30_04115 [Candidatus Gracilibacteria bacterium]|nr:hypothetical protein [Candidatus Gracilibacteria bacterium]
MLKDQNITENGIVKPLFTKSRILFLIVVFIVMLIPLFYRQFEYLLK